MEPREGPSTVSSSASEAVVDSAMRGSTLSKPTVPEMDEEYQIQLALELSAREDPEAAQIEAVKQISLGSCPPENSPAEIIAYRYWVMHPQALNLLIPSNCLSVWPYYFDNVSLSEHCCIYS